MTVELTIRNGLFEKLLTTVGLFLLCGLIVTGLILNHTQHAGFEDGNAGGSIVVSLSSAPGAEAAAFGETISEDAPEATSQQEAQTTPETTQPVEKQVLDPSSSDLLPETEIVEQEYTPEPQTDTIVPLPEETLPIESKQQSEPEKVEEIPEEPKEVESNTVPKPQTLPEQIPEATDVAKTALDPAPKTEADPLVAKVQKPKPKPEPPVYKAAEAAPPPKQKSTPVLKKVEKKTVTEKSAIPQPIEQADTGNHQEIVEATNAGITNDNQRSSGQKGVNSTKSSNTGSSSQENRNSGAGQKATGDYWKAVQIRLARNKRYPRKAKRRQMQGVTFIELTLLASGKVESYQVLESSGFALLDQAAIKMIEKSAPFPKFPSSITKERMTRRIPVVFNLKD
ncbi:TonB family protein [Kiloniella litopenaei]|uniref:TonB family protein n=1 Tax=Kiloniella litopenaei TaxID=1549748 RepID=UPI003BABBACB